MKKIIKISFVIATIAVVAATLMLNGSVLAASPKRLTCLVVGLDDAAENTDVLCIADLDFSTGNIRVMQIPRDTYFNSGMSQNKINQIFPALRAKGVSRHRAMRHLTQTISNSLALRIDGYVGITTQAFKDAVEFLGGLYVDTDKDLTVLSDKGSVILALSKGENILSPDQALTLARHRRGYIRGDLDRLDVQKLLINGFYKTVVKRGGYKTIAQMLLASDGVTSDISLAKVVRVIGKTPNISGMSIIINTMPGEALTDDRGVWYFSINRRGAIDILGDYNGFDGERFDCDRLFLKKSDKRFDKIYNSY